MKNKITVYLNIAIIILLAVWLGIAIGYDTFNIYTSSSTLGISTSLTVTGIYFGNNIFQMLALLSVLIFPLVLIWKSERKYASKLLTFLFSMNILNLLMVIISDVYKVYLVHGTSVVLPPKLKIVVLLSVLFAILAIIMYGVFIILNMMIQDLSIKKILAILIPIILVIFLLEIGNYIYINIGRGLTLMGILSSFQTYLIVPFVYLGFLVGLKNTKLLYISIGALFILLVFIGVTTLKVISGNPLVGVWLYPVGQLLAYIYSFILLIIFMSSKHYNAEF